MPREERPPRQAEIGFGYSRLELRDTSSMMMLLMMMIVYICIAGYMYVCMYVCMYVYRYTCTHVMYVCM